jgi:ATP-dependent Lon protease
MADNKQISNKQSSSSKKSAPSSSQKNVGQKHKTEQPAKVPTSKIMTRNKAKELKDTTCKKNVSSDDDEDFITDEEDDELSSKEYIKFLADLFPSKYMNEKVKNTLDMPTTAIISNAVPNALPNAVPNAPLKKKKEPVNEKDLTNKKERLVARKLDLSEPIDKKEEKNEKIEKAQKKSKKEITPLPSEEEDEETQEEEERENFVTMNLLNKNKDLPTKFNIIFTLGGEYEDEEEYDSEYDEDEDDDSDYDDDSEDEEENVVISSATTPTPSPIEQAFSDEDAFKKFNDMLLSLSETERNNPVIRDMMADVKAKETEYNKAQEKKQKKNKTKNMKKFRTLLKEKNVMNDVKYFKENMTVEQQQIVITQMEEIKKYSEVEKPYRLTLLESSIPIQFKACAYKKINAMKHMEPGASEFYKLKNWVDTFMQIPFGKHKTLPISIADGVEKCHDFMDNAKKILDQAVYGLNDAKLQIMQMIGQLLVNPSAIGTAIAIKGPMGTGKTTLIKDGISKILGRDFAFIALGGATDSSFLEGHSYTYEGSTWGRIVDIIINCKCMNPVIYFDELDKVSDTPRGEEIIGILTHLTDTTQNSKFHDKYFSEIDFDLSRCLFIFSYNDENKVNPILRDRMYRIHTKGYDQAQKTTISNNYLLPSIREQVRFNTSDITIPEETIHHIITAHTEKEDGVRNLKRCLEIIHTKLNLYRLMKPGTNLFEKDLSLKVEFPLTVTKEMVDKLITKNGGDAGNWFNMYS